MTNVRAAEGGSPTLNKQVEQTDARNALRLGTLLNAPNRIHNGTCCPVATRFLPANLIFSVLQSLLANLENCNLTTVLAEIGHWMAEGMSLFAKQWQAMQTKEPVAANIG